MESSSLSSVASWESRAIVVFPLPEGPQKRYALLFRIRLDAWMTRPWASTRAREYTIRRKVSTENSLAWVRLTVTRRRPRSTVPARSPRVTRKRAGPPSGFTTMSSANDRPEAAPTLISNRQPGIPVERKPLYRSRTTSDTSGSRVRIPVRRPAISILSSPTECRSHDTPHADREGNGEGDESRDFGDRAVTPPADAGIEPRDAAAPLDRDHPAKHLPRLDEFGECERVAFGDESLPVVLDHAVQEKSSCRRFVADHIAHADLRPDRRRDERDITVA